MLIGCHQIEDNTKKHFVIFSGFKIGLTGLQPIGWINLLILQLLEHHHLLSTGLAKTIRFYWIPSHVGIKDNDLMAQAAKDAINDYTSSVPVPYTDRRRRINTFIRSKWQTSGMRPLIKQTSCHSVFFGPLAWK